MFAHNQLDTRNKLKLWLKRIGIGIAILALTGTVGWLGYSWWQGRNDEPSQAQQHAPLPNTPEAKRADPTNIRIIASGDMVPHDALNAAAEQPDGSYEYSPMVENMKPFFDAADIRFCNQAVPGAGTEYGISGYPIFNSPLEFTRDMAELGCNLVNTASNHSNDKGQTVIDATVSAWDGLPGMLAVAGSNRTQAEKDLVRTFEVKGVKFAFLAYTTYSNTQNITSYGVNMYNRDFAKRQLDAARSKADIVLVSMRWGTEYSPGITDYQNREAQYLADNGADIIIGHGPHVLEPVKKLTGADGRQTLVWYSIGNFINAQLPVEALVSGFAVMDINPATKQLSRIGFMPYYMHYEWSAQEAARQDLLARRNFAMYPLDQAAEPLSRSQLATTVEEQLAYVRGVLNTYTEVPIISSDEY